MVVELISPRHKKMFVEEMDRILSCGAIIQRGKRNNILTISLIWACISMKEMRRKEGKRRIGIAFKRRLDENAYLISFSEGEELFCKIEDMFNALNEELKPKEKPA